ncbi:MAG: hypothetical protein ACI86C_001985 [Candidatus Latescibacterota bacterium]|jgi:hypothetical protein
MGCFKKWSDVILRNRGCSDQAKTIQDRKSIAMKITESAAHAKKSDIVAAGFSGMNEIPRGQSNGAHWIKRLSKSTHMFINTKGFFTKNRYLCFKTNTDKVNGMVFNELFLNMLSIKYPDDKKLNKSDMKYIMCHVSTRTWMNFWTATFNRTQTSGFRLVGRDGEKIDDVEFIHEIIIKNSITKKLTSAMAYCWNERWIEGDAMHSCTYVVCDVKTAKVMGSDGKGMACIY